jgi:hypothetical protein
MAGTPLGTASGAVANTAVMALWRQKDTCILQLFFK